MGFPFPFRVSDPLGLRADVLVLEQVDPAVEMRMRKWLADEKEMVVVEQHLATKGLVGIEVVAEQRGVARVVEFAVGIEPSLGGGDFAVLLVVPVLRSEKLDAKRNGQLATGGNDDGGDGIVVVGCRSIFMVLDQTVVAPDFIGGVDLGSVDGNVLVAIHPSELIEQPLLFKCFIDAVEDWMEHLRVDRVEQRPHLILRRNPLDSEQGFEVVFARSFLEILLSGKKGWTLRKKYSKRRQPDILHRELHVCPGSLIREGCKRGVEFVDDFVESFHRAINAKKCNWAHL